ncbi:endonuclease domain-containing protein [Microterricola viridarii]|uniref:DUF559 domain-containing protein n=2 Tax=Microterricola TaxID=518733 RepID=A0A109QX76_9MICO|nr:DUF559 domain-containing protein [Microterricola viridarii]AMB57768.1 hypothetical protein AWU67_01575 [Microterricola viridarii]
MHLADWLNTHSGTAHLYDVERAGYTSYAMRAAIAERRVRRIRRRWLATPAAPENLLVAATLGARLSCLSAAAHFGLWHLDDGLLHLSVPPNAGHFDAGPHRAHWGRGPLPSPRYGLVEPLENALVHIADCQPFENALAVWESAQNRDAFSPEYLAGLHLRSAAANRVRTASTSLSYSGIETIPRVRLERLGIRVQQQVLVDGHRLDGLIGERLVLQIDGFAYHQADQRGRDIAADRRLVLRGYTVLRFDYKQILFDWPTVEAQILAAMARGAHLAR